jgi:serine/threonine protein phosphatase 1
MELVGDLSIRYNVYPIVGEHDYKAVRMLSGFEKMIKSGETPDKKFIAEMTEWAADGGQVTLGSYRELDAEMREGILDYLSDMTLYEEVSVGGKDYLLVHAGIKGFKASRELDDYEPEDFFVPAPFGARFFNDRTLIVGHLPTDSGKIEREDGIIRLDCGLLQGGTLCCLCLETGEEYYV